MINSSPPQSSTLGSEEERVDAIVRSGPGGAIAVAGIATAIVIAIVVCVLSPGLPAARGVPAW